MAFSPVAPIAMRGLTLRSPVMLAPMCGVGDRPYLEICREIDAESLLATEMVSAPALRNGGRNTTEMIDFETVMPPVMIQIFGHDPEALGVGCRMIEEAGAAVLSMNFGCPAKKIVKNCDGAALLKTPEKIGELLAACTKASRLPMIAKMRLGWDDASRNYLTVARIMVEAGADAIAVHGRTREQGYSGTADWEAIGELARRIDVPIIGNGDVTGPEDAYRRIRASGVAGVMIGRAAMGNPWILERTRRYLTTGELLPEPDAPAKLAVALRHVEKLVAFKGERYGITESRKHLAWYLTGLPGAAPVRARLNQAQTLDEVKAILSGYLGAALRPAAA